MRTTRGGSLGLHTKDVSEAGIRLDKMSWVAAWEYGSSSSHLLIIMIYSNRPADVADPPSELSVTYGFPKVIKMQKPPRTANMRGSPKMMICLPSMYLGILQCEARQDVGEDQLTKPCGAVVLHETVFEVGVYKPTASQQEHYSSARPNNVFDLSVT